MSDLFFNAVVFCLLIEVLRLLCFDKITNLCEEESKYFNLSFKHAASTVRHSLFATIVVFLDMVELAICIRGLVHKEWYLFLAVLVQSFFFTYFFSKWGVWAVVLDAVVSIILFTIILYLNCI